MDGMERIFTHDEVKVNSPDNFNDPFDCGISVSVEGTDEDFKNLLIEHYKEKYSKASDEEIYQLVEKHLSDGTHRDTEKMKQLLNGTIKAMLKGIGVYCLSEKNDDTLMWSHYADGHKGFCLEFEAKTDNSFLRRAFKVKYRNKMPKFSFFKKDEWIHEFLITKSGRWCYEKEWRIIDFKGPGIYQLPDGVLSGVIFGCRISEPDEKRIASWLNKRKKKIRVYRSQTKKREFSLDIIGLPSYC